MLNGKALQVHLMLGLADDAELLDADEMNDVLNAAGELVAEATGGKFLGGGADCITFKLDMQSFEGVFDGERDDLAQTAEGFAPSDSDLHTWIAGQDGVEKAGGGEDE
jgi:hypothetical protein